jgi:uncharacterized protein (DUF1501 family)
MILSRRKFIKDSASAIASLVVINALTPSFGFAASHQASGRIKNIIRVFLAGGADTLYLYPYVDGPMNSIISGHRPTLASNAKTNVIVPSNFDQSGLDSLVGFHQSWKPLTDKLVETSCGAKIIAEFGVTKNTSTSHEIAKQNFALGTTEIGSQTTKGFIGNLVDVAEMNAFSVWGFGVEADQRVFHADSNPPVVINSLANFNFIDRAYGSMSCDGIGNCPKTGDRTTSVADDSAYGREISKRLLNEVSHTEIPFDQEMTKQLGSVYPAVAVVQGQVSKMTTIPAAFGSTSISNTLNDLTKALLYTNSASAPASLRNGAKLFFTSVGGWDSHSNQSGNISSQISVVAQGLAGLVHNLKVANLLNETLIIVESEFGRTNKENGSSGTDHAQSSKGLLLGGLVNSGVVGKNPSLTEAQTRNYLTPQISFTGVWKQMLAQAGFANEILSRAFPMTFPGEEALNLFN